MLNIKIILLFLLFLFTSCSEKSNYIFDTENSTFNNSFNFKGGDETLDIITWNIENYPKNNSTNYYVKEIIDSLNVDFIALQEIESSNDFSNLSASLGDNWYNYRSDPNSSWGELAFLVNTNEIYIMVEPYTILNSYEYEFGFRPPLVVECLYNNQLIIFINIHYKCCSGSESRRLAASNLLYNYVNTNHQNDKVIILGDFNDVLTDIDNNVFSPFLSDPNRYYFADYEIAISTNEHWSFPNWPSHIDHILITNELINNVADINTILIDASLDGSFSTYENYISDHRPVGIKLFFNP